MTPPREVALRTVSLCGIPTSTYVALHLYIDDLLREFEIIDVGHHSGAATVGPEVSRVARAILDRYRDSRQSAWHQAHEAAASGLARLDLELTLPPDAADDAEVLGTLFERADDLARAGVLLTVPMEPALLALQRWMVSELVRQLRTGATPSPCPAC